MPAPTPDCPAPAPAPTPADRRRADRRRPVQNTVGRLSAIADDEELARGLVWDVSTTGVSLLLAGRVEPGTLARAELTRAGGVVVCRVLRVVRLSRLGTGDYALGAQFVRPLDEAELGLFLA
jgi:hypothetical protein